MQQVRALHQARGRREQQLLLLEGTHLLQECRRLQLQPQRLIATERWLAMHPQLQGSDVVQPVSPEVLTAMATTDLKASSLKAVPFNADGISYLDTEWPATSSSGSDASDASQRFRFLF